MNLALARFTRGVLILSLFPLWGCGKQVVDGRPALVKVSGTVFHNHEPCSEARVVFAPKNHSYAATAKTDSQGKFTLQTFDPEDGAVPGEYHVAVSKFEVIDLPGGGIKETFLLPQKYRNARLSGLTAAIPAGGTDDIRIELND